jgi:transposase-like protein
MSQHFLLSAAARTFSLSAVARMSDEEAHAKFVAIRWADTDGQPYCPECGCAKVYAYATRKLGKCSACRYQFSVTARTIFQDRKRPIRDYLLAIAIFVNGAKGHAALQLSRDLDCQYKTAFVLAHKLREAMGSQVHNPDQPELGGESATVEVDGAYFGGHVKPENRKADRRDRRGAGRRQVLVVAREVAGRTMPFIVPRKVRRFR